MEKIVTHPLYIRCKKVIESCETEEHAETAFSYIKLAEKKTDVKLTNDLNNLKEWVEHLRAWMKLRQEIYRRLCGIR